ncbi:MAG: alpha-L-fucosidase, partial [Pseudonocardiales bacterium]|nr:alpha-L-fucosidase [Pseudonocardiales bacterium]
MRTALIVALLASLLTASVSTASAADAPQPIPVPIDTHFNNDGIDTAADRTGNFDGSGYVFPAEALPSGQVTADGVPYLFPGNSQSKNNNVVALGQRVDLPRGRYLTAHFLVASSYGAAGGTATVHYADGSTSTGALSGPDWYSGSGPISAPYRYSPGGTDQHPVSIGTGQVWADPSKDVVGLTLPVTNPAAEGKSSLHVFALSLQPAGKGQVLAVRASRSTTKLPRLGGQTVEATVVNLGDQWLSNISVRAEGLGLVTLAPASVKRLAPGEEARVRIGIHAYRTGTFDGRVVASSAKASASQNARFTLGVADYQATDASLGTHESPYWFDDAKFGIFIHWG